MITTGKRQTMRLILLFLVLLCLGLPTLGQDDRLVARSMPQAEGLEAKHYFQSLRASASLARGLKAGNVSPSDVAQISRAVAPTLSRLEKYPQTVRIHGHEEPLWLVDRGQLSSLAVICLAELERAKPDSARRRQLELLSEGLVALRRTENLEYPYGAHLSWKDHQLGIRLADGSSVPSALYRTRESYAVEALARASRVLGRNDLLESAQQEALGMSTHLLIHGNLVSSFSPKVELSSDINEALPMIGGFLALYEVTGQKFYSDLAALSTRWLKAPGQLRGPEWSRLESILRASPSASLLEAESLARPVSFQYVEAEDGKVVGKAIETLDYETHTGQKGRLAVMGRDNTFWMRFDVPTEDDYFFDLSYLQSDVGGGLVSVKMRIDGDKIFQVPLGDVDGRAIFRRKYVDGPRPLRSGPHSFGIRFSGLLSTKPALLDSVVVQPSLERREFRLNNGDRLMVLRNGGSKRAKTDLEHFAAWPPKSATVVTDTGVVTKLGAAENRRRRKWYVTLPPNSVAIIRTAPSGPNLE